MNRSMTLLKSAAIAASMLLPATAVMAHGAAQAWAPPAYVGSGYGAHRYPGFHRVPDHRFSKRHGHHGHRHGWHGHSHRLRHFGYRYYYPSFWYAPRYGHAERWESPYAIPQPRFYRY